MELIYGLPDTINNINSQNISVLIINDGFNPIYNLPISYKSNNNSAVTETWTGTLATNDTASFIFTTPFTPSIGNNDIKAYTSLSGDLNPLNDTAYHKLVVHQVFDASISAIISPNNTINNFLSQSVAVMVKNYGTSIISNFPISYQVNGNPPIVEACTLSIMPGDSALFTFNSSFMPTSINLIRAYSSLAGDQVSNNDTAYKTVIVIPGSSIGGTVFAGVYPIDFGIAYLYALDTINNSLILNDSAIIDTLGHYDFHNIMAGTYIVKSLLTSNAALYGQYITTYYGDAMFWTNATQINLASTNVWGADINLIPVVPLWPGTGNISGTVVNSGIKSSVEGVEILLLNDNNQIVAVEYSDASGFYKFSLIPLNSYTVYPEVTGLKSYSQIIVLDSTNQNITGLDISIGSMNVIVGLDGEANKPIVKNINVYPNPMQERINIQFALTKYSEINFQIFNQAGQLIKSHNSNKGAGEHIQQFELIELPQGVYFLQIIADGQTIHKKFIKLK
jgi:hypothetical protein